MKVLWKISKVLVVQEMWEMSKHNKCSKCSKCKSKLLSKKSWERVGKEGREERDPAVEEVLTLNNTTQTMLTRISDLMVKADPLLTEQSMSSRWNLSLKTISSRSPQPKWPWIRALNLSWVTKKALKEATELLANQAAKRGVHKRSRGETEIWGWVKEAAVAMIWMNLRLRQTSSLEFRRFKRVLLSTKSQGQRRPFRSLLRGNSHRRDFRSRELWEMRRCKMRERARIREFQFSTKTLTFQRKTETTWETQRRFCRRDRTLTLKSEPKEAVEEASTSSQQR